jgi:hypothetical protein
MRREQYDAFGGARQRTHSFGGRAPGKRDWANYAGGGGSSWASESESSGTQSPRTPFSRRPESRASENVPPSGSFPTFPQVTTDN